MSHHQMTNSIAGDQKFSLDHISGESAIHHSNQHSSSAHHDEVRSPLMSGAESTFAKFHMPQTTPLGKTDKYRTENVGWRLAKRKELFARKRKYALICMCVGLLGILLMIIETEITIANYKDGNYYWKSQPGSILIKISISLSTVVLLLIIAWIHVTDVKLFMVDNSLDDWRLALSKKRVFRFVAEIIICLIHPLPGNLEHYTKFQKGSTEDVYYKPDVPVDVFFSIPMFLRLYLCCQVMVLNNKLFTDARSQSLGALNRISFDFKYVFKSLMTSHPVLTLSVIVCLVFIAGSWSLHSCEMYRPSHANFHNSMWVIAITFLTIGYGDLYPTSICGRAISVIVGMIGVGTTALVVAVLARKLELSRNEKYVHSFMLDMELDKKYKNAAANILREGWLIYRAKKRSKPASVRVHQRRLLQSIHLLRDIKTEQRRMQDGAITIVEMSRTQEIMHELMATVHEKQEGIEKHVNQMNEKFNQIDSKLNHLYTVLSRGTRHDSASTR